MRDKRLISAFLEVPLEEFIPQQYRDTARIYDDSPSLFYYLNRDNYRTISAPHMISIMLQGLSLKENDDLLILGAKSGYIAALAHKLAPKGEIVILEANSDVANITSDNLKKLNLHDQITVVVKNPLEGMKELSPWQKILVTGAIKQERIHPLLKQLDKDEGVLYAPIGEDFIQVYTQILRAGDEEFYGKKQLQVRFTPLMTQIELDELQLITDFDELEEVEIKEDPSKIDKTFSKFEERISVKYDPVEEFRFEPSLKLQEPEVDLSERDAVITSLEKISEILKKLKKEGDIENCFSCMDDMESQIEILMEHKKNFNLKMKKLQNLINQIRSYNIIRKEFEIKENPDSELINKKVEVINKQIELINDLNKLISNELDRLKKI